MKNFFNIFILTFLLVSCGKDSDGDVNYVNEYKQYKNDSFFNKYKDQFMELLEEESYYQPYDLYEKIEQIPIFFTDDIENNSIGACGKVIGTQHRFIKINNRAKESVNLQRIVFHELGHCLLDLPHYHENRNDLMFPTLFLDTYSYFNNDFINRWIIQLNK